MVLLAGRTADRRDHMASGGCSQLWRSRELPDGVTARVGGGVSALSGGLVLVESHESWPDLHSGENTWTYTTTEMPVYGRFVFLAGPDGDSRGADRGVHSRHGRPGRDAVIGGRGCGDGGWDDG